MKSAAKDVLHCAERNIVSNIRMAEEKVVRTLDRATLARVFANLLNNVIKYSDGTDEWEYIRRIQK